MGLEVVDFFWKRSLMVGVERCSARNSVQGCHVCSGGSLSHSAVTKGASRILTSAMSGVGLEVVDFFLEAIPDGRG